MNDILLIPSGYHSLKKKFLEKNLMLAFRFRKAHPQKGTEKLLCSGKVASEYIVKYLPGFYEELNGCM